ncbi:MAG: metallophosphoesterase [Kiritimatiellae bacterium]|nr:metallophosphoesterase [Kiritimatiellia bacterium]
MKQTRRSFIATGAAACAIPAFAAETPLLRIGAMTDNHLHPNRPATHRRTRACFELFRKANVDIIADTGDIADLSHLSELKWFRAQFDELFAGTSTVPFFLTANHDYNYLPNTKKNDPVNFRNAADALGMKDLNPTVVVKGYRFTSYFQNEKLEVLEKNVAAAVAANEPGKPVFVVTHVPPFGTTTGTEHWSSRPIRNVLNKYPQVVNLTGHIHTAITWASNIWQGEFTAINLGAHAEYSNPIDGEAVILDVFVDRIDVRRYEAVSGREIGADDRWSIPLPLDPAHGPYRPAVRAALAKALTLPSPFTAGLTQDAAGTRATLTFPAASPRGAAYHYRLRLEAQDEAQQWQPLATLNWEPPQDLDVPQTCACPIVAATIDGGRPHRLAVTPVDCYDQLSATVVSAPFTAPASVLKALPAELSRPEAIISGNARGGKELKPDASGWISKTGSTCTIILPAALTAELKRHKNASCRFDIGSDQTGVPCTFSLGVLGAQAKTVEMGLGGRFYTLQGRFERHRYAWVLAPGKLKEDDQICLVIREGDAGRYRLNDIQFYV